MTRFVGGFTLTGRRLYALTSFFLCSLSQKSAYTQQVRDNHISRFGNLQRVITHVFSYVNVSPSMARESGSILSASMFCGLACPNVYLQQSYMS